MKDEAGLNHVGMPQALLLDHWGLMLYHAFQEMPYLVGSATEKRAWRDIDIRIILDDGEFESWFPQDDGGNCTDARWSAICCAFSLWGKNVTGLPIDFQVQRRSKVSEADWSKPRIPVGLIVWRQRTRSKESAQD